jgi:LuxR family transcriptional regulator, maltose regulon positive regulatory protein
VPIPVLATKLYAPAQRGRLVPRSRLLRVIDTLLEPGQRLALVTAPAGFGKTTLVSGWTAAVAQDADPVLGVAWVSLDEADNDLERLMTHILAALEGAGVSVGTGSEGVGALDLAGASALVTAVVNQVAEHAGGGGPGAGPRWVLVLDDYHVVTAPAVHETLTFLLDHMPEPLRLLVSTRSDPPLPLARLRSRGQLTEVRAADLRFTHEEAGAFLNQVMGLDLAVRDVEALGDRTEGWAAGLQLAALSLRARTATSEVSHFIEAFTGSHRFVVDYLADEVLAQQPEGVRDFLLRTSILERLTGGLCDAVTGATAGAEVLDRLDRDNLFVVPLDDARIWYRYHHLFADVLRARLLASRPGIVPALHRAASDWYAAHDVVEDAVRHAFAAQDFHRAGQLVETALSQMRRQRRDRLLLQWLRALPEDVVRPNPVLSTAVGWAALVAGDLDELERRLDDAERALAAGADDPARAARWIDTEDLRAAPAGIEVYRAALAQARGDRDATAAHARAALELAGPEDHFIRGAGAGFLGLAAWAKGDIAAALPTFEQSVTALRAGGNHVDALDATIVLADMWVTAGRPSQARALYERALRTATAQGEPYPRATADLHTGLAELALGRNDLTEAEDQLATAATLAERASITENQHRWPTAMAWLRTAQGQYARALDLLDEAADRYRPGFYPDLRPIAATRARIHLAGGDLGAATEWAAQADVHLADAAEFAREYELLTLVRVDLARHRTARAHGPEQGTAALREILGLLDRLASAAVASGRHGSVLEIRMLQALAQHACGDVPAAVSTLARAVETAAPDVDAYTHLFLAEGPAMVALLEAAATSRTTGALPALARRLLGRDADAGAGAGVAAPSGIGSVSGVLPSPLSEREQEVLRLLATELTGPQIARELFISLNTLRTHTKRIFTKLDVTNRSAALRRGRQLGLL